MPTHVFTDSSLSFSPLNWNNSQQNVPNQWNIPQQYFPPQQLIISQHQSGPLVSYSIAPGNSSSQGSSSSSEGAASSNEENSNSPLRSPDTTTLDDVTGSIGGEMFLDIVEEPHDKYRFRYKTEMTGTHGAILGINGQKSKGKTYPQVKLFLYKPLNRSETVIIRCELFTTDENEERRVLHTHRLLMKDGSKEGKDDPHDVVVSRPLYTATFQNMSIIFTKKEAQENVLKNKYKQRNIQINPEQLMTKVKHDLAIMNLNTACLRFEALADRGYGFHRLCRPVFSKPISNIKNPKTNIPKICRVSRCAGTCLGRDEVFIFVEKVVKDNIKVQFYEVDTNKKVIWSDFAEFQPQDVHHQFGIAFRTPPYKDPNITANVLVHFQLYRPSDKAVSDPVEFEYTPNPNRRKRPRLNSSVYPATIDNFQSCPQQTPQTPVNTPAPLSDSDELEMAISLYPDIFNFIPNEFQQEPILEEKGANQQHEAMLPDNTSVVVPDQSVQSSLTFSSAESDALEKMIQSGWLFEYASHNDMEEEANTCKQFLSEEGENMTFDGPLRVKNLMGCLTFEMAPAVCASRDSKPCEKQSNQPIPCAQGESYCEDVIVPNCADDIELNPSRSTVVFPEVSWRPSAAGCAISPMDRLKEKLKSCTLNSRPTGVSSVRTSQSNALGQTARRDETNEFNIVERVERIQSIIDKYRRCNRITQERAQNLLVRIFSYGVGEHDDSVLHILANVSSSPLRPQVIEFINSLRSINVAGSVIDVENNKKETPLLVAAERGSPDMVALLLDAGAAVNATDARHNTAAHRAVMRDTGTLQVLSLILKKRPNLGMRNEDGYTVLHLAVVKNKPEVISTLLVKWEEGSVEPPNLINQIERKGGNTALHLAVRHSLQEVVNLLLNFQDQIDVNLKNYVGETPLAFVMDKEDDVSVEIREQLLRCKADPLLVEENEKMEDNKDDSEVEEDIDVDVEEEQATEDLPAIRAYADEWAETDDSLFDKTTISKLCPLLDKNDDWEELASRLNFSDLEKDYCKICWSPSLMAFKIGALQKGKTVTAEIVRDQLLKMSPRLQPGVKVIDDMLLAKYGVE